MCNCGSKKMSHCSGDNSPKGLENKCRMCSGCGSGVDQGDFPTNTGKRKVNAYNAMTGLEGSQLNRPMSNNRMSNVAGDNPAPAPAAKAGWADTLSGIFNSGAAEKIADTLLNIKDRTEYNQAAKESEAELKAKADALELETKKKKMWNNIGIGVAVVVVVIGGWFVIRNVVLKKD